jgi:metal-responsive CopG/Arc/MetJ family transcriptional regulator
MVAAMLQPNAAKTPKLRGRRQPLAVTLPPELVVEIDEVAAIEDRSRVKMIELLIRAALAERRASREPTPIRRAQRRA